MTDEKLVQGSAMWRNVVQYWAGRSMRLEGKSKAQMSSESIIGRL